MAMSDNSKGKSVGTILRQARLARKGRLPEISEDLRISLDHLKALEEDDPDGLPGSAYAVGFIRSYADYLDLDTDMLIAQYKSHTAGDNKNLDFPVTEDDFELPRFILVAGLIVVSSLAYLFWAFLIDAEEIVLDKTNAISSAPENFQEASAASDEMDRPLLRGEALPNEAGESRLESDIETGMETPADDAGENEGNAGALVPSGPEETVIASVPPEVSAEPRPSLHLRSLGQTWLRITDGTGRVLYSSIILKNETFELPKDGMFTIDTFDAGNLEYVYGDTVGPRLGRSGENLRGKAISVKSILNTIQ